VGVARVIQVFRGNPPHLEGEAHKPSKAAQHEHVMAKSLFRAGTTWPGVFFAEDQNALDVLCSRDDVDVSRIGCACSLNVKPPIHPKVLRWW
jgi:hypothetical protein